VNPMMDDCGNEDQKPKTITIRLVYPMTIIMATRLTSRIVMASQKLALLTLIRISIATKLILRTIHILA